MCEDKRARTTLGVVAEPDQRECTESLSRSKGNRVSGRRAHVCDRVVRIVLRPNERGVAVAPLERLHWVDGRAPVQIRFLGLRYEPVDGRQQ